MNDIWQGVLDGVQDVIHMPWWGWLGVLVGSVLLAAFVIWRERAPIRPFWLRLFGVGAYGAALRRRKQGDTFRTL